MVFESGYVQLCVMKVKKTLTVSFWLAALASKKSFEAQANRMCTAKGKVQLTSNQNGLDKQIGFELITSTN